ncbi:MAG: NTP transferase domain-containing protein, partial [Myxococcota bacterium]|nr:NTP transferase domain-containing protein [Myxococcota bacterium]
MEETAVVLLAAGKGTRMISARPKLLHDLAGRPLGLWIVGTALALRPGRLVVVVGHGREEFGAAVRSRFPGAPVSFALQREQLGTGHALRCGLARVPRSARRVLVLYGDTPLVPGALLMNLAARRRCLRAPLAMVVSTLDDPAGYGRIVRDARDRVARKLAALPRA